ncbi:uncharacterized protein [Diadema antillarum]|uniref:uncharacterized protein isoform X2 n=1 Tax=Diadema antillarum TaxID=105358 RepID=UPI003A85C498
MHCNLGNVILLLLVIGSIASSEACGKRKKNSPKYRDGRLEIPGRTRRGPNRLRRSVQDEALDVTPPPIDDLEREEVFSRIDLDNDDMVGVVEWSLEGGTLSDFWALITEHDTDGDEMISIVEFAEVPVRLIYE